MMTKYPFKNKNNINFMSKGNLRHIEFEFTALIGAVTEIKHKQTSKFHLSWKIVQQNENKQIIASQYLQPNKNGVISFSVELKTSLKLVFNRDTNTFLKKKSMLCLNYADNDHPNQHKLAGFVTIDLASLANKPSDGTFEQHVLERSQFKSATITLKLVSKKLKQELINSFNWQSKNLSIDSLFDKTMDKSKSTSQKKVLNPRKNINKLIKQQFSQTKKTENEEPVKDFCQSQKLQEKLREQKQQNQQLLNKIHHLQKQNSDLKQNFSAPNSQRVTTLEEELAEMSGSNSNQISNLDQYNNLIEENKYILNELQKVSLQLANRQKQMAVLKSDYDKLRRKEKKKEKAAGESVQLQQQMYYLSAQVMRLHEELANHRQTEVQNNQLKRQKTRLQQEIKNMKIADKQNSLEISSLKNSIDGFKYRQEKTEQSSIDQGTSILCIRDLISQSKIDQKATLQLVQHFKLKNKQGLTDLTNRHQNLTNSKIKQISMQLQKLKSIPLNGMPHQNKKNLLHIIKRLDSKMVESSNQ